MMKEYEKAALRLDNAKLYCSLVFKFIAALNFNLD